MQFLREMCVLTLLMASQVYSLINVTIGQVNGSSECHHWHVSDDLICGIKMTLKQFVFAEVKCSSYERCVCWPCSWPVKCIRWLMWPSVKWMGVNGSSWLGCRLGGASDCIKAETCSGGPNGLDGSSGSWVNLILRIGSIDSSEIWRMSATRIFFKWTTDEIKGNKVKTLFVHHHRIWYSVIVYKEPLFPLITASFVCQQSLRLNNARAEEQMPHNQPQPAFYMHGKTKILCRQGSPSSAQIGNKILLGALPRHNKWLFTL